MAKSPTEIFKDFLADEAAPNMYIEGEAGTGKTTQLIKQVEYMRNNDIPHVITAHTHKACGILRSKLPEGTPVRTFHSWLCKRPTINHDATSAKHIESSMKCGDSDELAVLCIDEFSMIGSQDVEDLLSEQYDKEGNLRFKVLWLGDPNQLPPVGDKMAVIPHGIYHVILKTQYRTLSPLYKTLQQLVECLEGRAKPAPLLPHSHLVRGVDLESAYLSDKRDKVLLAFTNERVEELNARMQGYDYPEDGDLMFSPTTKNKYNYVSDVVPFHLPQLDRPFGEPLDWNDKFKTLDYLISLSNELPIKFMSVYNHELDEEQNVAVVFGHYQFKLMMQELKQEAAEANEEIESRFDCKAATWCKQNQGHMLERRRAKAWRRFLTVNQNVICMDFAHAMTVHKSQGSTYEHVYVDSDDMMKAQRNMNLYLRLTYVAFSRASVKVITN